MTNISKGLVVFCVISRVSCSVASPDRFASRSWGWPAHDCAQPLLAPANAHASWQCPFACAS
eukprot:4309819-Alexandrium_andersonii.AAC.1